MTIRVSIADDHPMVIDGIRKMLEKTDIELMGKYTHGASLLEGLQKEVPDILLLDIQMPGKSGQELMPELRNGWPEMRIIALTGFDQAYYVKSMISLGVQGYVLKSADKPTVLAAIRSVYEGEQFIDSVLRPMVEEIERKRTPHLRTPLLTPRELELLQLIARGLTSQEMAEKLQLSIRTVQNYRSGLLLKLDAKNATILLKKAMELKLIE